MEKFARSELNVAAACSRQTAEDLRGRKTFSGASGTFERGQVQSGCEHRCHPRVLERRYWKCPGGLPQFGVNTPLPHSAPNAATSPFYKRPSQFGLGFLGDPAALDGNYVSFNFAAFTPALPPGDRQV